MNPTRHVCLLPLLAVLAGCASTPSANALQALPACFTFERNEAWSELGLPTGVRLDAERLGEDDRLLVASGVGEGASSQYPFNYWRPLRGDTIQVGSTGGGPLQLEVVVAEADLAGRGRFTGDVRSASTVSWVTGVSASAGRCSSADGLE